MKDGRHHFFNLTDGILKPVGCEGAHFNTMRFTEGNGGVVTNTCMTSDLLYDNIPMYSLCRLMHFGCGTLSKARRSLFHLLAQASLYVSSMSVAIVTKRRTSNSCPWVRMSEFSRSNFMQFLCGDIKQAILPKHLGSSHILFLSFHGEMQAK